MISDAQKYFTLRYANKEHKGKHALLLNDSFFKYTHNPDYVAEILLDFRFANITNHYIAYAIVSYSLVALFMLRMRMKDLSLRRKPGFEEYDQRC